jgi:molecular chaperone GrpE
MIDHDTRADDPSPAAPLDAEAAAELRGVPADLIDADTSPPQASAPAEEGARVAELEQQFAAARQDVLYARAEAQNVRRRMEKDIADARAYAATGFARDILSVSDNLSRALDHVSPEMREDDKLKGFLAGIEATQRELEKAFAAHGISRIASLGLPLDPHQHQAMLEVPSAEAEPGTIVQELQAGYKIKERLLRPAMVAVAKKPA